MDDIGKLYQDEDNQAVLRVTRDTNGNPLFVSYKYLYDRK